MFLLKKDGEVIFKGSSYFSCLNALHREAPHCSGDHAMKYEGWTIEEEKGAKEKCQICKKEINPLDIYNIVDDDTGQMQEMCEECFLAGNWPKETEDETDNNCAD